MYTRWDAVVCVLIVQIANHHSSHLSLFFSGRRTRPLAPACNVRLIRNDLSTIWCELTSSIRTRQNDDVDVNFVSSSGAGSKSADSAESGPGEKELLLCFRPIREGEAVGPELRFCPNVYQSDGQESSGEDRKVSSSANGTGSDDVDDAPPVKNRPPKKRKFHSEDESLVGSNRSRSEDTQVDEPDEKSAIESMMELAKNVL